MKKLLSVVILGMFAMTAAMAADAPAPADSATHAAAKPVKKTAHKHHKKLAKKEAAGAEAAPAK